MCRKAIEIVASRWFALINGERTDCINFDGCCLVVHLSNHLILPTGMEQFVNHQRFLFRIQIQALQTAQDALLFARIDVPIRIGGGDHCPDQQQAARTW